MFLSPGARKSCTASRIRVLGKGKIGLHNRGVTFWLPVAKLGPLPKTPNNRAMRRIPSDLASPLPLNPEAHRPQDALWPQCSAAYLKLHLGSSLRSPRMFGGPGFRTPPTSRHPKLPLNPAYLAWVWSGSVGRGREDALCRVSARLVMKSP